jgi:hypothetical protein
MASFEDLVKNPGVKSTDEISRKAAPSTASNFKSMVGPGGFPSTPFDDLMKGASDQHQVPYDILYNTLKAESGFNPKARNKTSTAKGIAQFIDSTAKEMGIDPLDPKQAIPAAAKYLKSHYDRFGSWKLAVAAYNQGPGAVAKKKGIPDEAIDYVAKIVQGRDNEPDTIADDVELVASESRFADSFESLMKMSNSKPQPQPAAVKPSITKPAQVKSTEISESRFLNKTEDPVREYFTQKAYGVGAWHPAFSAEMAKKGFGPKPAGGWDELGRPIDEKGIPYFEEPAVSKNAVVESTAQMLKGLSGLATRPMEAIKGGLDFFFSLPAFKVGLLGAAGRGTGELIDQLAYGTLDLDKIYSAMVKGMQESFEFFEPGKEALIGKPTEESQLVGQIAMAPLNAISAAGQQIAALDTFKDYPNVRGATKIIGDLTGLIAIGLIVKGPSAKAEFSKVLEDITNDASNIVKRETQILQNVDSLVRAAELKKLEIDKQRLENKAAEFARKFQDDVVMTEEMGRLNEQLAKEKLRPVVESRPEMAEGYVEKPVKLTKKEAEKVAKREAKEAEPTVEFEPEFQKVKESIESNPELSGLVRVDAIGAEGTSLKPGSVQVTVIGEHPAKGGSFTVDAEPGSIVKRLEEEAVKWSKGKKEPVVVKKRKKVEEPPKVEEPTSIEEEMPESHLRALDGLIEDAERPEVTSPKREVVTEIDRDAGAELPGVDVDNGMFFQNAKKAKKLGDIFDSKREKVLEDPEVFVQKLINDTNRWYHGDSSVDITKVRDLLSQMASRASELRDFFITGVDHLQFTELTHEAAKWARSVERPNLGGKGVRLNMMVPIDQIPETVKQFIRYTRGAIKSIRASEVARDKNLWKSTGYWLGRDGKWRYELDTSKAKYSPSLYHTDKVMKDGVTEGPLTDFLNYRELYEAVPQTKSLVLKVDKKLSADASYNQGIITLRDMDDVISLFHELQHAVNEFTGSVFIGTNEFTEHSKIMAERLRKISDRMAGEGKTYESTVLNKYVDALNDGFRINNIEGQLAKANVRLEPRDIQDINFPTGAFEKYVRNPGEMEARLAEKRLRMSKDQKASEAPWETLDKMLVEELRPTGVGRTLYTGTEFEAGMRAAIAGARKVAEYTSKARGLKKVNLKEAAKVIREEFNRAFVDKSGNIRKEMLDKLKDEGFEVVKKMYLAKGASSLAAAKLRQMRKEVYHGLTKSEKKILDDVILDDRMIDIAKYKSPSEFKFPKGVSIENFIQHRIGFHIIEKLSPSRAALIEARAAAYYEWMKRPLMDMLESGLISKKEFDDLSSHNYRRLEQVEKIFDSKYRAKVGGKKITVYDSGVEALRRGKETDIYEPSSEIMALEVFNRAYGRILKNEANKSLVELARRDPTNPFVRIRDKSKGDAGKIPEGWTRIFAFEDGTRKSIHISPEVAKEWVSSGPEVSYRLGQFLRYASGSPVLRTFATGINWGFALANIPRDVMHSWFTSRSYENGKWKPVYNPNLPVFMAQMGRDIATVLPDALTRGKRYQDYLNEGGGMEFLVHQGRLFQRGRHLESWYDRVMDFMGYLGETSEIMTRLAIRERMLRKGKSGSDATFAARDYMDFGQGGGISKALDNALPYLNASIQGTRGMFRAFKPGSGSALSSTYKLTQFAALITGLTIAMQKMHPETAKNLVGNIDAQNNLIIPLGDQFGFEDAEGQMHYPYLKIPLDPAQKFFKTFFEAATNKWLGKDVDVDAVTGTLTAQSPVGISQLPPTISGALGYLTNKDFWLNEDIWKETDRPFSYPKSAEEFTRTTPEFYKDLGAKTGLSPERTRYAVEELVTGGTVWSYLLGQGYDAMFRDVPKSAKQQHLAETISKVPMIKRFIGITNPYSKHATKINTAQENAVIDQFVQDRGMDTLVYRFLYDKNVDSKELFDYASSFGDKPTYDRLIDRFKWEVAIKDLPEKSFWRRMKGLRLEAKANVFVDRLSAASEDEKVKLMNELEIVGSAKGIVSKEFKNEVMKVLESKR